MKELGHVQGGGIIVELTANETKTLEALDDAIRGRRSQAIDIAVKRDWETMDNAFRLIRQFARARFLVAEFERATAYLREGLLTLEGGSDE